MCGENCFEPHCIAAGSNTLRACRAGRLSWRTLRSGACDEESVRGCRREPSFINAAALSPECIDVVGMKFQPSARDQKRAGYPARLEPENSRAGFNGVQNLRLI